jgi:hypothetical protein
MRLNGLLFLFICAGKLSAQVNYRVEYDFSMRINNTHSQFNNGVSIGITHKNMNVKACLGYENWFLNSKMLKRNPYVSDYGYSPQSAFKSELWIGYASPVFKTHINIGMEYGLRFYFPNQVEDSLSMYGYNDPDQLNEGLHLTKINRATFDQFVPFAEYNDVNGVLFHALQDYYFITKMRMAHLLRVHVGYTYKSFQLKLFYMPYLIRFEYQNARYPEKTGSNYLFFHDVGASISYTFPKRNKEKK